MSISNYHVALVSAHLFSKMPFLRGTEANSIHIPVGITGTQTTNPKHFDNNLSMVGILIFYFVSKEPTEPSTHKALSIEASCQDSGTVMVHSRDVRATSPTHVS